MTIVESIKCVLQQNNDGLTSKQIYDEIIRQGLYSFGAENPVGVVNAQLRRRCIGLDFPTAYPIKFFEIAISVELWYMFVLQGGERMKYKLLKDLYDCFCTPPELQAQKQEIEECHQALSKVLGKLERRLVLQIIDAKDRIAEETSIDSFIAGFELAWKLSVELNHYENERSVSCQTAMGSGARFASKEEEK